MSLSMTSIKADCTAGLPVCLGMNSQLHWIQRSVAATALNRSAITAASGPSGAAHRGLCENFLYGFKAAPRGRTRRRHGGLVVAHADAPAPPGPDAGRLARKARRGAPEPRGSHGAAADLTRGPRAAASSGLQGRPEVRPDRGQAYSRRPASSPLGCCRPVPSPWPVKGNPVGNVKDALTTAARRDLVATDSGHSWSSRRVIRFLEGPGVSEPANH